MKYIFHQMKKRLQIHWLMILKGIVYGVLLYMYATKIIDTQEWVIATGSVMTLNSILSKDSSKLQTKTKFQRPDPGTEDDYEHN